MIERLKSLFTNASKPSTGLSVDLHSHLVPGIDDGAKTMDESIALVRSLYDIGYRKLITTPHTMAHRYPNDNKTILEGLEQLRKGVAAAGIAIELEAASEYYLDEHFLDAIIRKGLLTFGENEVLFEMSYITPPPNLDSIIFEMTASGYVPVLAHPERYLFFHDQFERYRDLKDRGVRFQVNINSLGGYYSKPVQKTARRLMQEGMIDYLGSDTHHMRHIDALKKTLQSGVIARVEARNRLRNALL